MSTENHKTLEAYEQYADKYLEQDSSNADKLKQDMLKKCLVDIPKDAKIFEVGSAGGKDAEFFRSLGYKNIAVSDVPSHFLKVLKKKDFSPIKFNLIKDEFPDKYDFIYCWAVLMHFTKEEARSAVRKMYGALNSDGKILMCVKTSEDEKEEWANFQNEKQAKVYFSFWEEKELRNYLNEVGFCDIKIWRYGNWLDCLAKKGI